MTTDKLCSIKEVAEYLNVNVMSVRNYIYKGWLKAHKLGEGKNGVYRIYESDLTDFVNRNSNVKGAKR